MHFSGNKDSSYVYIDVQLKTLCMLTTCALELACNNSYMMTKL